MNRVRRILLGVCVVGLSGLLGCSQKKVAIEDTEMWLSGGESRLQNLTSGCDERGNFSLAESALNKDLSLDQLRIVALAQCLAEVSDYCKRETDSSDSEESDPVRVSEVKIASQFKACGIGVEHKRTLIRVETTIQGESSEKSVHEVDSSISDKIKITYKDENLIVVSSSFSESDSANDADDDYHVYVKEGLTFQKFLDLLKDNGLPVKILAERLEIRGKVTEGTAELLKDDSVAVEKKAEKVLLEKDAEVNLACYAIIDGSKLKLKQKDGK